MKTYKMITLEQTGELSLNSFVENYNDAIETIWHLQNKLCEQMQENEQLWKAYEEIFKPAPHEKPSILTIL